MHVCLLLSTRERAGGGGGFEFVSAQTCLSGRCSPTGLPPYVAVLTSCTAAVSDGLSMVKYMKLA